jgi:hypothetical protein
LLFTVLFRPQNPSTWVLECNVVRAAINWAYFNWPNLQASIPNLRTAVCII